MKYRNFGKLGFEVSALGFGAMRLPEKHHAIDETHATGMLRYAIDRGVNYVDTAYPYHGGKSEEFVGRALRDGYREKVKIATKLPSWLVKGPEDFDKFLTTQLERLGLDYVDFYLLHALNRTNWPMLRDLGVLQRAEKAIQSGRIHYLGFSFHDDFPTFKDIIDAYDWPMCQIQYNYVDVENGAGTAGLRYAASKGIAVVVMEPLLGGRLVAPPPPVQAVWDEASVRRSAAGWGMHWLWNQGEVATVLSGVSNRDQIEENVALAESSGVGMIPPGDLALVERAREAYKKLEVIPCTSCGYCLPCPQGVDIPGNFSTYNAGIKYDKKAESRGLYAWWKHAFEEQKSFERDIRAAACIQCGECEPKCPQAIPIASWMPVIDKALGENGPYVTSLN